MSFYSNSHKTDITDRSSVQSNGIFIAWSYRRYRQVMSPQETGVALVMNVRDKTTHFIATLTEACKQLTCSIWAAIILKAVANFAENCVQTVVSAGSPVFMWIPPKLRVQSFLGVPPKREVGKFTIYSHTGGDSGLVDAEGIDTCGSCLLAYTCGTMTWSWWHERLSVMGLSYIPHIPVLLQTIYLSIKYELWTYVASYPANENFVFKVFYI